MSWKRDLETLLGRLPTRFTILDINRFIPWLHDRHPDNNHIEEKIRQILQQLRDDGKLRFLERGLYEQTKPSVIQRDLGLIPGQLTTRSELASLLGQKGSAPLNRGMFKPARGPFQNHMFLFHNERENPYGDIHEGDVIRYVGQGMTSNQEMKGFNAILAHHLDNGIQVHYFIQPKDVPKKVRYKGLVFVDKVKEVIRPEEGRSVWEFTLLPVSQDDPMQSYGDLLRQMIDYQAPPGPVERPKVERLARVRLRSRAFRDLVVPAYQYQCALCVGDITGALTTVSLRSRMIFVSNGCRLFPTRTGKFEMGWNSTFLFLITRSHIRFI